MTPLSFRLNVGCRARASLALGMIFGLLAAATPAAAPAAETAAAPVASPRKAKLRVLFANSLIQNVSVNDVLAAFKLWIETVGRNRGYILEAEPEGYDRRDEVEQRLRAGTLDLVVFTSMDYLQFAEGGPLQPVFSPVRNQETLFDDYVLVTRRDRNVSALSMLRGKSVALYQVGSNQGRRWLEIVLDEGGLGNVSNFFGTKSDVTKPSSAVLPVFFGKLDAGVVNRSSLETMIEMNPQLATQLQVLTNSSRMPESVICLHRDYANIREDLLSGLADLHTEPRGQQLLLVFKIGRLLPFKPEYLEGVRDLKAREKKLGMPLERKTAASPAKGKPES